MRKLILTVIGALFIVTSLMQSQIMMSLGSRKALPFISKWNTEYIAVGSTPTKQIKLPLIATGSYNFVVDWGDGNTDHITNDNAAHTYASAGEYTITIRGEIDGWKFNSTIDRQKITEVKQWGILKGAGNNAFAGCWNLQVSANDQLDCEGITDFSRQFYSCTSLTSLDVSDWDVSTGQNFSEQFSQCNSLVSLDVSDWEVGAGLDFSWQFDQCTSLLSLDVSNWNVEKGTDFSWQFYNCFNFSTLDVSDWEVGAGLDFSWQFGNCTGLTSLDVSNWNVEKGTNFSSQFLNCSGLNVIDVSIWNVVEGQDFRQQFEGCTNLTGLDVSNWNVISAIRFDSFMNGCPGMSTPIYNQTLIDWKGKLQSVTGSPNIDFGNSKYTAPTSDAATARAAIEALGWAITDGGSI